MGKSKIFILMLSAICFLTVGTSCDDNESYAERLEKERKVVNAYLSGYSVSNEIPADLDFITVEEVGEEYAPYYRIEPEGNVYMQVVRAGDRDSIARTGDKIYFRYSRFNISTWYEEGGAVYEESNSVDMEYAAVHFYYNDFTKTASATCGIGIQLPLSYLGINSEVNLVIKSQYGPDEEMSDVTPYRWNIRYIKSAL